MEEIKAKKTHDHVFTFAHLKDTTPVTKERAAAYLKMLLEMKKYLKESQGIEME